MPRGATEINTTFRGLDVLVDKKDPINNFLSATLFPESTKKISAQENIQYDELVGGRTMAPFNRPESQPTFASARKGNVKVITIPNITLRRGIQASDLLDLRSPGETRNMSEINDNARRRHLVDRLMDDVEEMEQQIANRKEWMVAKMLTGTMSYSVEGMDSFTIDYAKPAANSISAGVSWATTATANVHADITAAKRIASKNNAPMLTHAFVSEEASTNLQALIKEEKVVLDNFKGTDGIKAGNFDGTNSFNPQGALFLGQIGGIQFWEYSRTDEESGDDLIREGYVEFVSLTEEATRQRRMFYGPIEDLNALRDGRNTTDRFVDFRIKDQDFPSVGETIVGSRPLPFDRRIDWTVSLNTTP